MKHTRLCTNYPICRHLWILNPYGMFVFIHCKLLSFNVFAKSKWPSCRSKIIIVFISPKKNYFEIAFHRFYAYCTTFLAWHINCLIHMTIKYFPFILFFLNLIRKYSYLLIVLHLSFYINDSILKQCEKNGVNQQFYTELDKIKITPLGFHPTIVVVCDH